MGCNAVILLDTHTLIWLDQGSKKLGKKAREKIDAAFDEDALSVSAITWWEVAMLQDKGRIKLPPMRGWYRELIDMGLKEIPIDGLIGVGAVELEQFHGDPADRLITATAMLCNATLITADKHILDWRGSLDRSNARH